LLETLEALIASPVEQSLIYLLNLSESRATIFLVLKFYWDDKKLKQIIEVNLRFAVISVTSLKASKPQDKRREIEKQ